MATQLSIFTQMAIGTIRPGIAGPILIHINTTPSAATPEIIIKRRPMKKVTICLLNGSMVRHIANQALTIIQIQ